MNKLGFYTKNFTPPVIDAIKNVKPRVLLTQLDDIGVLENMRSGWSPNTFVIGRFHFPIRNYHPILSQTEDDILDHEDPEEFGRILARHCIEYNFNLGTRRVNEHLLIDAWMSLNESIPGPASGPWQRNENNDREKFIRRAEVYDTLQVAFLEGLQEKGLEAVAFNFAAGNWITGEDYIKYFPKTLEAYTYLGFHEYGWPHMNPDHPNLETASACGIYRKVMKEINEKYGHKHEVIITEAGLTRAYKMPEGGDVGWLYKEEISPGVFKQEVSEESYKDSLRWYNQHLVEDDYVKGACLFQVGSEARWETFEHVVDLDHHSLSLMNELYILAQGLPSTSDDMILGWLNSLPEVDR